LRELALFAGSGGGILGGRLLGWRTVCAVEWDDYAASVLVARQNDGSLDPFPIWDDVQTFDGRPWRGAVDVVSGGFPCQDISVAGKGAGIDGVKSGMWRHMARIIGEVRPRHVLVENSPMLVGRGLARVLGDLAAMGYDARWGVLGAHDVGAPHKRDRLWIVATDTDGEGQHAGAVDAEVAHADLARQGDRRAKQDRGTITRSGCPASVAHADGPGRDEQRIPITDATEHQAIERGGWWSSEPDVGRMAHGVANRMDRLRCVGNGQVPSVVALAWRTLIG